MRDLACCANGMAFYSTPSDLVRFALATNPGRVNGVRGTDAMIAQVSGRLGTGRLTRAVRNTMICAVRE